MGIPNTSASFRDWVIILVACKNFVSKRFDTGLYNSSKPLLFIFGADNATVVQRTFTESDFVINNNVINVTATKIITSIEDLSPEDYPIVEFERNASKATQTSGLTGRGIIIRISPKGRMDKAGSKANNLILKYNDIM